MPVLRALMFSLGIASLSASLFAQSPRAMTVDDALDTTTLGNAVISPDGRLALYSQTKPDWDDNKRETEVYMVPTDGGDAWRYLGDDGGSAFAFSPDGRYLAFLRAAKKKDGGSSSSKSKAGNDASTQLWWMRVAGGEAVQLTEHDTSIQSFEWMPDSRTILFKALDERPEQEDKDLKAGGDAVFVNEGANGQEMSYWSNLWSFDTQETKEEKATKLTDEKFLLGDFDPSPDGKSVALTARYRNRRNDGYLTELFVLDIESKTKTRLTENEAPESDPKWSPKGDVFVYAAADDEAWLNRNTKIWLMDPERGEHSLVSGSFEGSISNVVWTPDGSSVLFVGQQGVHSDVYRMNVRSGEYERLTSGKGWLRAASFSADRKTFVYSYSNALTPTDLFAGHLGSERPESAGTVHGEGVGAVKLTDLNPQLAEVARGEMRVITWKSHDGLEVEGLLHLPLDYEEGKRYPLMLNIHGGPAGYFADMWRPHYHIYSGLGYASLSPNVRGSSGYTDALREGNTVGEEDGIGLGDYHDLMTGVDQADC